MHYFRYFPSTAQTIEQNGVEYEVKMVDVMIRFKIKDLLNIDPSQLLDYRWKDHDRPDLIAKNYYGSTDFTWLVYFSNDAHDAKLDFPRSYADFNNYLFNKYKSDTLVDEAAVFSWLNSTVDHYEDPHGLIVDYDTYTQTPGATSVTVYDQEFNNNEKNRVIKLVNKDYVKSLTNSLRKELGKIRSSRG